MPKIFTTLDKIKPAYDITYKVVLFICKLLLIADIIITTMSVIGRYVPFIPDPAWSEEVVLTCMSYMAVLSAALAIRRGAHIRMTAFDVYLPKMVVKVLDILADLAVCVLGIIMLVAPIGLGAYFANLVATYGPEIIGDYGRSMLVYYPLCALYGVIFFPLYAFLAGGRRGVAAMVKNILRPAVTAFATQSSAATIPVNKEACDSIGVPKDVSDLVLPMGCTMHMDGSVLSSITKIAFLYGVFGMDFSGAGTYGMAIVVAILSAFVLSGAPGGGLVGEMLIVSMFNFPAEAFPIIATLGFLFDPAATCLNASGDTIASMLVTRLVEGKEWLAKAAAAKKSRV